MDRGFMLRKYIVVVLFFILFEFIRFGDDLLSRGLSQSTISAARLNFRVRDGIEWFPYAITTKSYKLK